MIIPDRMNLSAVLHSVIQNVKVSGYNRRAS